MLAPLAIFTLSGAAVLAAPANVQSGVPYTDITLPFSGKEARSQQSQDALHNYMRQTSLCHYHPNGEGRGTDVSMDGPDGGSQYTLNITIAGEMYNVIFDTGSSDLWLPASNFSCEMAANPMVLANYTVVNQTVCDFGPTPFNASDLDQLKPLSYANNFNITYGVPGYSDFQFATGTSYIGGVAVGGLNVPNARINIVYEAEFFGNTVSDGLMGFGGPGLTSVFKGSDPTMDGASNYAPYLPWFHQAVKDGLVAPYFSIALNRPTFVQNEGSEVVPDLGTLSLGGLPKNVGYTGKHVTVKNIEGVEKINGKNETIPLWWTTSVDEWIFPGSKSMNTTTDLIILDSGTFNIYAPNDVAAAFAAGFNPPGVYNATVGGYQIPCNATVPDLKVVIGGVEFCLQEEDLFFPITTDGSVCLSTVTNGGNSTSDVYILGDKFLNNVVASFNVKKDTISIYQRTNY